MQLDKLEDFLMSKARTPECNALLDLVDALRTSATALYNVNLVTNTKLEKPRREDPTPELFTQ